jgi:hypothetical protein
MFRGQRLAIRMMTFIALAALVNGCAQSTHVATSSSSAGTPPAYLLGNFIDDYGGRHSITPTEWEQGDDDRYRIVRWNAAGRYLIAENNSSGPTSLGRWTRIDWMQLDGKPPYTWAFCFSAYEAPTAAVAESSMVAKSATSKTECNGYPFIRMRAATSR